MKRIKNLLFIIVLSFTMLSGSVLVYADIDEGGDSATQLSSYAEDAENLSDDSIFSDEDESNTNGTQTDDNDLNESLKEDVQSEDETFNEEETITDQLDEDLSLPLIEEDEENSLSIPDISEDETESDPETETAAETESETEKENNVSVAGLKKASQKSVSIKTIKLNKTSLTVATKSKVQLSATLSPANADNSKLLWKSSNTKIATVDKNGKVTALRYGKATITAYSKDDSSIKAVCTVQTRYYDVKDSSKYFYTPVYWAANKKITQGYDNVYFGIGKNCSRVDFAIFLWRYAGKPSASGSMKFKDVKYSKSSDSYKAILWCSGKGIIKGYSDGTFKPGSAVLRKDALIMMYRYANKPFVAGNVKFTDVAKKYGKESDTYKAILWGSKLKVAGGYPNGNFNPLTACLREQAVTFLYRYNNNKSSSVNTMTAEKYIWTFLKNWLGKNGAAGVMGNLYVESGLVSNNLEDYYNIKFKVSDTTYTKQVDNGKRNFVDNAGYGLAQWTYYTRKQALLKYAKSQKVSVGNLEMQLNYMKSDMNTNFKSLVSTLKNAKSVKAASDAFMLTYERPYDQSNAAKNKRASYGQTFYNKYGK